MKIKNFLWLVAIFLLPLLTYGQSKSDASFIQWNEDGDIPVYVKLFADAAPSSSNAIHFIQRFYKMGAKESLKEVSTLEDELGYTHIRYQLYYKEIPVNGSVIIGHYLGGKLMSFNGEYYGRLTRSTQPNLTEHMALDFALKHINADEYMWESEEEEKHLKLMDGQNATYYPKGKLIFEEGEQTLKAENFRLTYAFNIYASKPHSRVMVYVDATSGVVLKTDDLIHTGDVKGKARTRYSDTVDIVTDSVSSSSYRLRQTTHGKGIETYNMRNGNSYGGAVDFFDGDNFWENFNAKQNEIATDAHWGAEKTYEYFYVKHNRNSFDNNGAKIRSYVHRGNKYNNAFWNGQVMTYGDGDSIRFWPLTCIDVCGHEVAHAVTTYSAGLVYRYESGALNESFSDIFGNAIERFARPNKYNYRIGEDITPNGRGIRNMARPNDNNHPDTYHGFRWYYGSGDNGGVHLNSGVQNHWYYILSEGDSSRNDNNDTFTVAGIGYEKAAKIAYRNLTVYLTRNSQYKDARFYAIRAAIDLYGDCSKEMIETTNAWYAVGVGEEWSDTAKADFMADTLYCWETDTVRFRSLSINSSKHIWQFGDGSSSTLRNPNYVYHQYGKFDVRLIVENCTNTQKDTATKVQYIHIDSSRLVCKSELMPAFGIGDTIRKCKGYLMDNGGEFDYITLRTSIRTIAPYNATKVHAEFLQFAMEDKYDSLYVYDGWNTSAPLIGGYTGFTLPPNLTANSGAMTIKHFADQLVVDSGFILKFYSEKPALKIVPPNDDTVCIGNEVVLVANANGGGGPDELEYYWGDKDTMLDTLRFIPIADTTVRIIVYDNCMGNYDTGYVNVIVNPVLDVSLFSDTTICYGQNIDLVANATGGDSSNYVYTWLNNGHIGKTLNVSPQTDSFFTVVLSDGCSLKEDTAIVQVYVRDSLSLTLSKDSILCQGNDVTLTAIGSGGNGNYSYTWNRGLGLGDTKLVKPLTSDYYTVTLVDGCTIQTIYDSIFIEVRDSLKLELLEDSTLCIGEMMDIVSIASGGDSRNYNYQWSVVAPSDSILTITASTTQKYSVILSDGCSSIEPKDSVVIAVRDALDASIFGDTTICYGQTIDLIATASGGEVLDHNLTWDNGLGSGGTKSVNPLDTTNYMVVLTDGCTALNDTARIAVNVLPALDFDKSKDTSICIGEFVDLSVLGKGGNGNYSFLWNQGLGMGTNFSVSPVDTLFYRIVLSDGCSNDITDSIKVSIISNPTVEFIVDDTLICTGESVQFTNTTTGIVATEFDWSFGTGLTSTLENPSVRYDKAGLMTVRLFMKNDNGCQGQTTKVNYVRVVESPVADFTFTPNVPDFINSVVTFNNTSTNATFYDWDFGNGDKSTNGSESINYGDTGTFNVRLIAINSIGCADTNMQTVHIRDIFTLNIPDAFTPNEDGINDLFVPIGRGVVTMELTIANRWGEIVFETKDKNEHWNGAIFNDGDVVSAGTYIYLIRVLDIENKAHNISGTVNVLR